MKGAAVFVFSVQGYVMANAVLAHPSLLGYHGLVGSSTKRGRAGIPRSFLGVAFHGRLARGAALRQDARRSGDGDVAARAVARQGGRKVRAPQGEMVVNGDRG